MKKLIKRYAFPVLMALALGALLIFNNTRGVAAIKTTFDTLKEMLFVLPPIFILLGLLDIWVPKETMVKFLGEGSGIKGILIAILIGSAPIGPLYAAFPVAAVFMKKGAKFSNIVLFLGAWSTTKVPMIAVEVTTLGSKFGFVRLSLSLVGICLIALIMHFVMKKDEVEQIYLNAQDL